MALYACMYFAALRPGVVVGLRRQDCHLPAAGWGRLTLEKSRPEIHRRWTDTDSAHGKRGSSTGAPTSPAACPSHLNWSPSCAPDIATLGVAPDGRVFGRDRGQPVASTAISDVWAMELNHCSTTDERVAVAATHPLSMPTGCCPAHFRASTGVSHLADGHTDRSLGKPRPRPKDLV